MNVGDVGLRKVTKTSEINRVLTYLSAGRPGSVQDWKDRFKENSDNMKGGSLLEIAEVFKALVMIQMSKPLSLREKKMLERSRSLLILETSVARSVPEPDAIGLIAKALAKCGLVCDLDLANSSDLDLANSSDLGFSRPVDGPEPPACAESFLEWLATPEFSEAVLGDFLERYGRKFQKSPNDRCIFLAKLDYWYWREVIRSIPGFLRLRITRILVIAKKKRRKI